MAPLKLIGLTLIQIGKQICLLPHALLNAFNERKAKARWETHEAERLDRIRNPSKYRGKEL